MDAARNFDLVSKSESYAGTQGKALEISGRVSRHLFIPIVIKPGGFLHSINCETNYNAVTPVGFLIAQVASGDAVDSIRQSILDQSVRCEPSHAEKTHGYGTLEHVDGDGRKWFHFGFNETATACSDAGATLAGTRVTREAFGGSDSIRTVGD